MANKSSLNVVIDNGSGAVLSIQSDASGYMVISMSDGKSSIDLKLGSIDMSALRNAISYADGLRRQIPGN